MNLTDPSKELAKRFENVMARIKVEIPFDPEWRSLNDFFGGAEDVSLLIGQVAKSVCPETHRRLILVGTVLGTVVVFERYSPKGDKAFMLAYHANEALDWILGGSYLSIAQFSSVVTDYNPDENIGTFINKLYVSMDAATKPKARHIDTVQVAKLTAQQNDKSVGYSRLN
jgi:hypothetical protein